MASAWTFFVLVASVGSSPVMKYSFCPLSNVNCESTSFESHSSFEFGNITSGVHFIKDGEAKPLSVSCSFHKPLHWILTRGSAEMFEVTSMSNNVTIYGSRLLYYYHIQLTLAVPGLIRCESYENPDVAAEIYTAIENEAYNNKFLPRVIIKYVPALPMRGGQLIVPCTMFKFNSYFDASAFGLKKLRRAHTLAPKVTPECFSCFPHEDETCTTFCPYGISQTIWNETGRSLGQNITGNKWLDCVRDPTCAYETITKVPEFENSDCNGDGETTCSDHFSAISSYPANCEKGPKAFTNFVNIEGCVVKNLAQSLDSTEADYDPRVGFRLKKERDTDSIYICSSEKPGVYFLPYNPNKKIEARLVVATDSYMNGPLTGILCIVPQKWMERVHMKSLACSSLFECELKLDTLEGVVFMNEEDTLDSKEISLIDPRFSGKMIKTPRRSGVVQCGARYEYVHGHIWDLQYFFTGLDSKLYFVSSNVPVQAVISLKKLQFNLTESNGFEIEVECIIETFIVFPIFEFLLEYTNGTSEQKSGYQPQESTDSSEEHSQLPTQRLKESVEDATSVVSIRCRAPLQNSTKWVEAILSVAPVIVEQDQQINSSKQAGAILNIEPTENTLLSELESNSPQIYVAVILAIASGIILIGSGTCVVYALRKYNISKYRRQLTLGEIDEFYNGNAASSTESSNEVKVDCIGFPESFRIPPEDLKINVQEVLGQGEFGLCISGDFHDSKVAVKTTKASMNVESFKDFLREVKIMAFLGKHENIVEFLGAVVNQLRDRTCLAVLELSPYGDLLSYLRNQDPENPSNVTLYVNQSAGRPCGSAEDATLGINILSYFCEQIAAAMEFVGKKGVIHGDLAARNVLVFPGYRVKITDFGLSRKLYTASNYKKKHGTPLPWRWMAIESFKYMEFSPMTDMWAYGVTVWEIFTMGQVPYAGLVYSLDFVHEIDEGRRLPCPKNATEEIFQLMKRTWDRNSTARPSFEDAKIFFRHISLGVP